MARIVGGIGSSHIPAIGGAIAQGIQKEDYWKDFFDGYPPVHSWLDEVKPDVAVVIYNDFQHRGRLVAAGERGLSEKRRPGVHP